MHTYYGIWIDHSHAYIIKSNKLAEMELDEMRSNVEPHHHSGTEEGERRTVTNQNSHNERRSNQMKAFSKEIIKRIEHGDEIVIFGPGTAKNDLKNEVEDVKALVPKLRGVETTDKMSEAEMKEFMKTFFHLPQN